MRLLLTGANGYLGRFLGPFLVAKGHELRCMTRGPCHPISGHHILSPEYGEDDLSMAVTDQEAVIHLAARAHQPGTTETLDDYRRDNLAPSLRLAKAAKAAGVKRFIYISSIKVNGEATLQRPFSASDTPAPRDYYGQSKWETEQALEQCLAGSQTQLVIVRPPLIWGGEVKGNLQSLASWIARGWPLPLGSVKNRRDMVSQSNLASLIELCLAHPAAAGQTFLVSDGQPYSSAQIVRLVAAQMGRSARIWYFPVALLRWCRYIPRVGTKLDKKIGKMIGNLEVDIQPTCRRLGWKPLSDHAGIFQDIVHKNR